MRLSMICSIMQIEEGVASIFIIHLTLTLKRAYFFWCLEFITIFLFFCKFGVQRMLSLAGVFFASWTQTAELTQPGVLD